MYLSHQVFRYSMSYQAIQEFHLIKTGIFLMEGNSIIIIFIKINSLLFLK